MILLCQDTVGVMLLQAQRGLADKKKKKRGRDGLV